MNKSCRSMVYKRLTPMAPPAIDLRFELVTEAASEGINLQVANVRTNFDLPWNPMIVEQRIGRVQRLPTCTIDAGGGLPRGAYGHG